IEAAQATPAGLHPGFPARAAQEGRCRLGLGPKVFSTQASAMTIALPPPDASRTSRAPSLPSYIMTMWVMMS
ncbi:MAG: hypothetical protein ACR2PL_07525, partial [Dehalococcoidia bacterium]